MTGVRQLSIRHITKCQGSALGIGGMNIVACSFRSCTPEPIFLVSPEQLPKCR